MNVSSGSISDGTWTSRQAWQTRACKGYVASSSRSASEVRNNSQGGEDPRSTKVVRSSPPHSRQVAIVTKVLTSIGISGMSLRRTPEPFGNVTQVTPEHPCVTQEWGQRDSPAWVRR